MLTDGIPPIDQCEVGLQWGLRRANQPLIGTNRFFFTRAENFRIGNRHISRLLTLWRFTALVDVIDWMR